MNSAINFDKLVKAMLSAPEMEEEIIALYMRADLLETMIAQRKTPDYFRIPEKVYRCIHAENLESKLTAVSRQMIGVICKAQRKTGFRILKRYLSNDEEKVEALREICSLFEHALSDEGNYDI